MGNCAFLVELKIHGRNMPKKKIKKTKVEKVMHELKEGKLHSGSKKGPVVTNRKQGIAIALSESRKAGEPVKPMKAKPKRKKK